ncbi:TroA family protein [Paenibacillus roseipurpureus]|uniref:Uncharacterized protein n=1 Tax=Paenibacillus roseopurpureus TaxID=2918901 RepID=A0AA96RN82_9BACL|nr:hypothetical protein [Paenibacillus sp. MBLB1832]WNR45142.1 hypothetical protein MJB10_03035 [Paenibacillus sp. MBLB1832]
MSEQTITSMLAEQLHNAENKEEFWKGYIEFIEKNLVVYFDQLKQNGIDRALLSAIHRGDQEESTKEKLNQVKQLICALSRLDGIFMVKTREEKELVSSVERWKTRAEAVEKQMEEEKAQVLQFRSDVERKLQVQQSQIERKLSDNLRLVRHTVSAIPELLVQASQEKEIPFAKLSATVGESIGQIVETLSNNKLWPESEEKPDLAALIAIRNIEITVPKKVRKAKKELAEKKNSNGHLIKVVLLKDEEASTIEEPEKVTQSEDIQG